MLLEMAAAASAALGSPKLIYCHMEECSWLRLVSNSAVATTNDGELRKYLAFRGLSYHRNGDYPDRFSKRVAIDWEHKSHPTYVSCSRRRPAVAWKETGEGRNKGRWYAHYLDLFDLYGYNTSSAVIYADACHHMNLLGLNSGDEDKALRRLGYHPGTRSEQVNLAGPMDLLKP